MSKQLLLFVFLLLCLSWGRTASNAAGLDDLLCPAGGEDSCSLDCIVLPANPTVTPEECGGSVWCATVLTDLMDYRAGAKTSICQTQIYARTEPLFGLQFLSLNRGTLEIGSLEFGDEIGSVEVSVDVAEGIRFWLKLLMTVTETFLAVGDIVRVDFEIRVDETNEATIEILDYNPLDASHSSGLLYEGTVVSFGAGQGFELFYEIIPPPESGLRGIQDAEMLSPNLNLPLLIQWFDSSPKAVFTLPPEGGLVTARATIEQFLDPLVFLQFVDTIPLEVGDELQQPPAPEFRRGDANHDRRVDLSDVIYLLDHLFRGRTAPDCFDAADADDDGTLSLTDALAIISGLFGAGAGVPELHLGMCDVDATIDDLPRCESEC